MSDILLDLKAFLDHAPTSWHAVKELGNRLAARDFSPLNENEKWELELGGKYFVTHGGTLSAFTLPLSVPKKAIILASHTDSPSLKLKANPCVRKENIDLFSVEVYGAPLLSSWLNRDLYLAGKVITLNIAGEAEEHLVRLDDSILFIPQLAIHLDREVNEKGLLLNKQDHLCPILGIGPEPFPSLEKLLRQHIAFHSLLSFELFLIPIEEARFVGHHNEMIASYRLDNLAGAHAAAGALASIEKPSKDTLQMAVFWDHEEIGSATREGAHSPFLNTLLERIAHHLKLDTEDLLILKNRSLCVSIDMAHGFNPNYPSKLDSQNQPLLAKGVVIKHNANQRYASTAASIAPIIQACHKANIPYQSFTSRADFPCGSTIGPTIAHNTGILTVDIGCPQLSMHSIREVIASEDYIQMTRLLTHLLKEA